MERKREHGKEESEARETYALTPNRRATSCTASTSTFTNCSFPGRASFSASAWKTGAMVLHGPHQVAWKSTMVYVDEETSLSKCAVEVAGTVLSGMVGGVW